MRVGSLFSGIGGFDLAAEAMGWDTRWFVEWDVQCRGWLAEHFPNRPIYGDISTIDWQSVEPIDVLCGGFPCQPVSSAGRSLGVDDHRWLWPQFARAIWALQPRWVVVENVPGLFTANGGRAFGEVLRDLAALGYDARWDRLSAAECGAPHKRQRVWLVAYPARNGCDRGPASAEREGSARVGGPDVRSEFGGLRACVDDTDSGRCEQRDANLGRHGELRAGNISVGDAELDGRQGRLIEAHIAGGSARRTAASVGRVCGWDDGVAVQGADGLYRIVPREAADEGPESKLWPVAHGIPGRVARLRAIGNAVVPRWCIEGPFGFIARAEAGIA